MSVREGPAQTMEVLGILTRFPSRNAPFSTPDSQKGFRDLLAGSEKKDDERKFGGGGGVATAMIIHQPVDASAGKKNTGMLFSSIKRRPGPFSFLGINSAPPTTVHPILQPTVPVNNS